MAECKHLFVLIHQLKTEGSKAEMIPAGYYCIRCNNTLLGLRGILGPAVWIKEDKAMERLGISKVVDEI